MCIVTVLSVQNNERCTSTQRKWNELIIQDESHWNQVLCLNRHLKRKKEKINRVFGITSEPVGNQNRTCLVKSLFQVKMKRLTTPEIPAAPSGVIPSSSTSTPISLGASSSSDVKRTYSESTALPNSLGVSSGSGVERAHGESIVNDDEEQPGTRARISNLIAGPARCGCCGRW